VSYSMAFSQAITILIYVCIKMVNDRLEYSSTKAISAYLNIPFPTVVKVLKSLNDAGLIHTKEGAGGGIMLARDAGEITMLDIFMAVEQKKPLFKRNFNFSEQNVQIEKLTENIKNTLQSAEDAFKNTLSQQTLKDLIDGNYS